MKINGPDGKASNVGRSPGLPPASGGGAGSRVASAATDKVQLSNLAKLAAAGGDSSSNVAKLSALSETVQSGRYQVDAAVVSNSIIEASTRLSGGYI